MVESSAIQMSLSRLIFTTWVWELSVCVCVLSRMLFRSSLWKEHKMPSVKPYSVRNAMATPTKRLTHAVEADIKSVCVSFVYLKAKSRGPTTREKARATGPWTQLIISHASRPVPNHERKRIQVCGKRRVLFTFLLQSPTDIKRIPAGKRGDNFQLYW